MREMIPRAGGRGRPLPAPAPCADEARWSPIATDGRELVRDDHFGAGVHPWRSRDDLHVAAVRHLVVDADGGARSVGGMSVEGGCELPQSREDLACRAHANRFTRELHAASGIRHPILFARNGVEIVVGPYLVNSNSRDGAAPLVPHDHFPRGATWTSRGIARTPRSAAATSTKIVALRAVTGFTSRRLGKHDRGLSVRSAGAIIAIYTRSTSTPRYGATGRTTPAAMVRKRPPRPGPADE